MRIKAVVEYDGSNFVGYQIQNEGRTIQAEIQKAIEKITRVPTPIVASGRTDALVHAKGQVFHFETTMDLTFAQWKKAINSYLPEDIHILSCEEVPSDFHARYSAIAKHYEYILSLDEYSPIERKYVYQLCRYLNVNSMQKAAKLFVGEHDFRNFCANDEEETKSFVRTITFFEIHSVEKRIHFNLIGNGFLRYEVRMIIGTLIALALGQINEQYILDKLSGKSKDPVPYRAPGEGLYLVDVTYPTTQKDLANYHTHTYRCGHAIGRDEEYVISAINAGYKVLGFSDHMMVPGIDDDIWTRGKGSELPGYLASIESLKKKYAGIIEIHTGLEAEYFPELEEWERSLLKSGQLEYLIFANHYRSFDGHAFAGYYGAGNTSDEDVRKYQEMSVRALKTGLFSYFAHPDLFMAGKLEWTKACEECAYAICHTAKELDIPLEINQGGIRYTIEEGPFDYHERFKYPYFKFWEIVKEVGNKVVIGVDIHDPKEFGHVASKLSYEFADKMGLKVMSRVPFKKIR